MLPGMAPQTNFTCTAEGADSLTHNKYKSLPMILNAESTNYNLSIACVLCVLQLSLTSFSVHIVCTSHLCIATQFP